jgi:type VI secretion system protein ImpK
MKDTSSRTSNLASCYENAITIIARLRSQQQNVQSSQVFRGNINAALKAAMEQARGLGYADQTVRLSFAGVVAFVDESILELQSPIFADWPQRPLALELFGNARMGEVFFENLRSLLASPDSHEVADCLEVYGLCLLLGFRGRYALTGAGEAESFIRPIKEKMARIRGRMMFLGSEAPMPEVKGGPAFDRWSRTLAFAALGCFLIMLLAFCGFWITLNSGLSRLT